MCGFTTNPFYLLCYWHGRRHLLVWIQLDSLLRAAAKVWSWCNRAPPFTDPKLQVLNPTFWLLWRDPLPLNGRVSGSPTGAEMSHTGTEGESGLLEARIMQ
jgi:hypothetical protein